MAVLKKGSLPVQQSQYSYYHQLQMTICETSVSEVMISKASIFTDLI